MRNFTAILLLAVLFASQYAKYISYVECRLANYFTAEGNKCDCEKILQSDNTLAGETTLPAPHNHQHPDESYFPPYNKERANPPKGVFIYSIVRPAITSDGIPEGIDHPPRLG